MNARARTHGGLRLETYKQRSTQRPLRRASVPAELILPLDQHAGMPARPIVASGDRLARGQPIARPEGSLSAWLHAPVAGRVKALEYLPSPQYVDRPALSIVIENDGSDRSYESPHRGFDYRTAEPMALCEHIALGGIVGLGGATFPTALKLLQARTQGTIQLLINGAECEPWISCDDMLMRERARDVIDGARILCRALQAKVCTIAVEDSMPQAASALLAAGQQDAGPAIEIATVPSIYPAGGERQLIAMLTGQEVPSGGLPQDIGVVCQNVGTVAAVAHWVRDGEPLIRRIVTVTGGAIREPANLDAALGTPMAALIADCGGYGAEPVELIMGGTMMGIAQPSALNPIVKATNCVLAAAADDLLRRGPEMPCIRCGACAEVCPAILLPQQLHTFALARAIPELDRYGLLDCIECGCCDYVCPSQIPLVERFRRAKPELLQQRAMRAAALAAKSNFEAREMRLATLEAERRDKLAAKRKAMKKDADG